MAKRIIRFGLVKERTGRGKTAIYADIRRGIFPAPINIGPRSVGWVEEEVDAWIEARIRESREKTA